MKINAQLGGIPLEDVTTMGLAEQLDGLPENATTMGLAQQLGDALPELAAHLGDALQKLLL